MLTPAGTAIFRSYATGLVWIQSWGPLYAVLHRISMGEAAERMTASALMPGGDIGISLIAQAGIRAVASDVAVMSGYLSMSVPFLAAALAYGLSKATVLATSVLAVGQDAASSAAHESTTGNISLANTSADTHRYATLEGRQIRTSMHVDADRYTGYAPGGAGFTVAGDGTVIADAGSCDQPHPGRRGAAVGVAGNLPRDPRGGSADPLAALVGRSRDGAQRRRHRRHRSCSSATPTMSAPAKPSPGGSRRARAPRSRRWNRITRSCPRPPESPRTRRPILVGEAKVGGGFSKIIKIGADGSASLARPDHREGVVGPVAGLCRAAPGARPMVAGLGGVAALLHRHRRERGGEPRREPLGEPDAHAAFRGARLARPPGIGELVRAGRAGEHRKRRRSTASSASPSSSGCRSVRARTGARSAPAPPSASPRPRPRRRPRRCASTPRPSSPSGSRRPAGPDPATVGGEAEYGAARNTLSDSYARETAAAYGGWAEGVRDRAYVADAPIPGEVEAAALGERARRRRPT